MQNPFQIVKDFENAVAEYTKAPYCVAVNSCTSALFICLVYNNNNNFDHQTVEIPKKTYIGVGQSILNAGFKISFREEYWSGFYQLKPYCIFDAARRFTSDMFHNINFVSDEIPTDYVCTSMHWSKILNPGHGGLILHNNPDFDIWARKFRFDGRTEGVAPKDDQPIRGHHLYLLPELAASGLVRLSHLPKHNPDLPNSDYPDLSKMSIFQ